MLPLAGGAAPAPLVSITLLVPVLISFPLIVRIPPIGAVGGAVLFVAIDAPYVYWRSVLSPEVGALILPTIPAWQ